MQKIMNIKNLKNMSKPSNLEIALNNAKGALGIDNLEAYKKIDIGAKKKNVPLLDHNKVRFPLSDASRCVSFLHPPKDLVDLFDTHPENKDAVYYIRIGEKREFTIQAPAKDQKLFFMPKKDYSEGFERGGDRTLDKNTKMLFDTLGLEYEKETDSIRYSKSMAEDLNIQLRYQIDSMIDRMPAYQKVDEKNINDYRLKDDYIIIGFGDPYTNGSYGAGPTRSPLRATYSVRQIVRIEDVPIACKKIFSSQKDSQFIAELYSRIENNYKFTYKKSICRENDGLITLDSMGFVGVSDDAGCHLKIALTNLKDTANTFRTDYNADLIMIFESDAISGHAFIEEVNPYDPSSNSPMFRGVESIFSNSDSPVVKKAGEWIDGTLQNFEAILKKILPKQKENETMTTVTVYNT